MRPLQFQRSLSPHRPGFALLLVVGCLLIVTVAAVSVTRRSLGLSLEAATLEEDVRRRWELATLERAGLSTAVAAYGGPPVEWTGRSSEQGLAVERRTPQQEFAIRLNGHEYHVVLADESAKANLNTAADLKPQAVAELSRALSRGRLHLSVTTGVTTAPGAGSRPDLFDWRDLADRGATERDSQLMLDRSVTAANLTIWGDGRINVLSASDSVLFEMSRLVVSDGDSRKWIAEFVGSFPEKSPQDVFLECGFDRREQGALAALLSTQSTAVSVSITGQQQSSLCIATRRGSGTWRSAVIDRSYTPSSASRQ